MGSCSQLVGSETRVCPPKLSRNNQESELPDERYAPFHTAPFPLF